MVIRGKYLFIVFSDATEVPKTTTVVAFLSIFLVIRLIDLIKIYILVTNIYSEFFVTFSFVHIKGSKL